MGAAQPARQPPAACADPAELDAWRLIVSRLRGENGRDYTLSAGASLGRVLAWAAVIAADELTERVREAGGCATLGDARKLALAGAEKRLLAVAAPDLAAMTAARGEVRENGS